MSGTGRLKSRIISRMEFRRFVENTLLVVNREPVTGPRSPGIVHRQSVVSNKLAPKPAPKPTPKRNTIPTLTLTIALTSPGTSGGPGGPVPL